MTEQAFLVSTDWLKERLGSPDIRVIDASWHLPSAGRDPRREYDDEHIPGAMFFDIDEIADTSSPLPHMAPPPEKFTSRVRKLGIGDGTTVVAYDTHGVMSAARAWWLFRLMGHARVVVLDGGLRKWKAEGLPVTDEAHFPFERHFSARPNWALLRSADEVSQALANGVRVIDARPPGRFAGEAAEPRAGLRAGHMPGALNMPASAFLNADGTMKRGDDLKRLFEAAGVDFKGPAIATCGSGVSACVPMLALAALGNEEAALYDGSWSEWGGRDDLPIATGPA